MKWQGDWHRFSGSRIQVGKGGFTLVELLVALMIVGLLVVVAVPSYWQMVHKSRRGDAMTSLGNLANAMERGMYTNNCYSNIITGTQNYSNMSVDTYYQLSITLPAGTCPTTYTLTATANSNAVLGYTSQSKDSDCQTFTLSNTGVKTSAPSTTECWN
ncbi:MAG: prepilin-type N-terminal cleavage/methylation domain-containing protein [Magnetococcales bacterium]|nr:prepilin-type N-terminal cleavage/methylation domain-containing protein [Magnetococcales bacterium]